MYGIDNQQGPDAAQSQPSAQGNNGSQGSNMRLLVVLLVVVAVVVVLAGLAGLFFFGVFNPTPVSGNSCISYVSLVCSNLTMNSNGQLSFTWGQVSGSSEYNIMFACASNTTSAGMPSTGNIDPWYYISSTGAASRSAPQFPLKLKSGEKVNITQLQCYNSAGQDVGGAGKAFVGKIWYNYTANASAPGPSNIWYTAEGASVSATGS